MDWDGCPSLDLLLFYTSSSMLHVINQLWEHHHQTVQVLALPSRLTFMDFERRIGAKVLFCR
jgi:hypothetical protein